MPLLPCPCQELHATQFAPVNGARRKKKERKEQVCEFVQLGAFILKKPPGTSISEAGRADGR